MKKRIIPLLLALVLFLTACQEKLPELSSAPTTVPTQTTTVPPETTAPPTTVPTETQPQNTFPLGSTGQNTDGVFRSIPISMPQSESISHFRWMDGKLLLVWGGMIQIWSAEDGGILQRKTVEGGVQTGEGCLAVKDNVIAYYNSVDSSVIFRDEQLNIIKTVPIPHSLSLGNVLISDDLTKAYHFADHTVYETNLESRKTRKLFRTAHSLWELSNLVLDGTVIEYWGKDYENDYYAYASLATGDDLGKTYAHFTLNTNAEKYLIAQVKNNEASYLLKSLSGEAWEMKPLRRKEYTSCGGEGFVESGLVLHQFFKQDADYNTNVCFMDLYDLHTGKRIAEIAFGNPEYPAESPGEIRHVLVDPQEPYIWIISKRDGRCTLYRWDYSASAVQDETVYLQKK